MSMPISAQMAPMTASMTSTAPLGAFRMPAVGDPAVQKAEAAQADLARSRMNGEDRVELSSAGRARADAYQALQSQNRVLKAEDPTAGARSSAPTALDMLRQTSNRAGRDEGGQVASRLHIVA